MPAPFAPADDPDMRSSPWRPLAPLLGLLAAASAAAQPVLEVRIDNQVQATRAQRFVSSEVGEVASVIVVLRNVGNQDLAFARTPVVLQPARAPWSLIQPPLETGDKLSPNGSTAFRLDFAPAVAAAPAEATVSIPTNAAGSPFTLFFTGTTLAPTLEVRVDGEVTASGTEIELAPVRIGETTQQVVVLRNPSALPLRFESPALVKDPSSDPSFSLVQPPLETGDQLSPNGSTAFLARFTPAAATAEPLLAEVAIPTNAFGSPFVLRFSTFALFPALGVVAGGVARNSGEEILLTANPGEVETLSVALRNEGTDLLAFDVPAFTLVGDAPVPFALEPEGLVELVPGAELELVVRFAPESQLAEPATAELRIATPAVPGGLFSLALVGSTPPPGCGNGFREEGEVCDGGDLGEAAACSEPGAEHFLGAGDRDGAPGCRADCLSLDASGCHEVCGNCADDDGDGLVDFEDPDCCGGDPATLALRKVRIQPAGAESKLQLDAEAALELDGGLASPLRDVFLQLRGAGDESAFCLRVPAAGLSEKGGKLALAAGGSGGLGKLGLRVRKKTGALRLQAAGKRLPFATPEAEDLTFAFALHEEGAAPDAARCAAATETLRRNAKGVRRFP